MLDVGGESTRPGAAEVTVDDEIARVAPVIEALAAAGHRVSVDTSKAAVAERGIAAGAAIVNDVTALGDPDMARVVADAGAGLVLMHMKGTPRTMQDNPTYGDLVGEVREFLARRMEIAIAAGVAEERIWLDPGHRLRQDRRPQPGADRADRGAPGPRPPGRARRVAEVLPREADRP